MIEQQNIKIILNQKDTTDSASDQTINEKCKKPVFRIKKSLKFLDKLIDMNVSEDEENEVHFNQSPKNKRISAFSKVNFTKLTSQEKDQRLKNLTRLVKKLTLIIRKLELRVKSKNSKILNKFLNYSIRIAGNNSYDLDLEVLCTALKKIKTCSNFEYDDQKNLLENLMTIIADDKEPLNCINFKKITSLVRTMLPKESIQNINKNNPKIALNYDGKEVFISKKELDYYSKYINNKSLMKAVLGLHTSKEDKINLEQNNGVFQAKNHANSFQERFPLYNQPYNIANISNLQDFLQNEMSNYIMRAQMYNNYLNCLKMSSYGNQ